MLSDTELVKLLGQRFISRKDVKSFQGADGGWYPEKCPQCKAEGATCTHRPMTMQDFMDHLSGTKTMGHYLVEPVGNTCKLFAFDLDIRKPTKPDAPEPYLPVDDDGQLYNPREALLDDSHPMQPALRTQLRILAEMLARRAHDQLGVPVAIADSGGKGLHVYCFTGSIPAEAARSLAHGLMEGTGHFEPTRGQNFWRYTRWPDEYQEVEIETFPKQAQVAADGMGNLMKLPLGVHRVTGKPSRFLTVKSPLEVFAAVDPIRALEGDLPWE